MAGVVWWPLLPNRFIMKIFTILINELGIVVGRYETSVYPPVGSRVTIELNGKETSRTVSKVEYKYQEKVAFIQVFLSVPVLDIL